MNRYDTASVAKFNPMSFQEVMFAPAMMRQKHDSSIAAAEAMRLNPDPLDVHYNRALQLKQEMDGKISSEVDRLNKEGFNTNTTQNITRLNREYQDLISPTGEVGRINAAKVAEAEAYKNWMSSEEAKKYGTDVAKMQWMKHRGRYNNQYNEDKQIVNIGQMSGPKYEDLDKDINEFTTNIGSEVTTKLKDYGWSVTPREDGSVIFTDGTGKAVNTTNFPQLQQALERLNEKYLTQGMPGYESTQFAGMNPQYVSNQIARGINSKLVTKQDLSQSIGRSLQGYKNSKEDGNGRPIYDFRPVASLQNIHSSLSKLGNVQENSSITYNVIGQKLDSDKPNLNETTYKEKGSVFGLDNLSKNERDEYDTIFKGLQDSGQIDKNIKPNDPKAYSKVKEYVSNTKTMETQNVVNLTDVLSTYGENSVGSTKGNTSQKMGDAISMTKNNRTYYNEKEDKFYSFNELPSEVQTAINNKKINVNGNITSRNHYGTTVGKDRNKTMFTSPLIAEVVLNDGKTTAEYLVSRTKSEMNTKSYKSDEEFGDIWSNTTRRPGLYYNKTINMNGNPTNIRVQYLGKDAYDQNMFEVKGAGTLTDEQLENLIYRSNGITKK